MEKYVILDVPHKPGAAKPWRASCFYDDPGSVDFAVAWAADPLEALSLACAGAKANGWAPESIHIKTSALARLNGVVDSLTDDPGSPVFGLPIVIRPEICPLCGEPLVVGQVVATDIPGQTSHLTCAEKARVEKKS